MRTKLDDLREMVEVLREKIDFYHEVGILSVEEKAGLLTWVEKIEAWAQNSRLRRLLEEDERKMARMVGIEI